METEKKLNAGGTGDFIRNLDELILEFSKLFNNWSITRNARVVTISGNEAKFDYVMQDLNNTSRIITVKVLYERVYGIDLLLGFIMNSIDAVAWRYLIITPEEMDREKLELCEDHGAIVYTMSQLIKIWRIGKLKTSLSGGKLRSLPSNLIPDNPPGTSVSSNIKNTLANIMKTGRKRRDRSEIIEDILYWSNQYDGILITRLVYKTNLNHKLLRPIVEELCSKNILKCNEGDDGRKYYRLTELGLKYLYGHY